MPVVIGNIYDMDYENARRLRERMRRNKQVWNSHTGQIETGGAPLGGEDESGLTIHHEVDPQVRSDIHNLTTKLTGKGVWIAALGGILLGLLIGALATWWLFSAASGRRR